MVYVIYSICEPGIDMLYKDIEFRLAKDRLELEKAYRLVCSVYREKGYLDDSWPWDIWVMPYCMHPETVVGVAILNGEVIGTSSLFFCKDMGLPVENTYEEAKVFEHPVEIGKLAVDEKKVKRLFSSVSSMGVVLGVWAVLYNLTLWKVFHKNMDYDILIEVLAPHHIPFYERLGFKVIFSPRIYAMLDKTVYCMHQPFRDFRKVVSSNPLLRRLFSGQKDEKPLDMYKLSWDDVEYFLKEKTDMWNRMDEHYRKFLSNLYRANL